MEIEILIGKVAKEKGINSSYELMKAMDISPSVAVNLYKGTFKQISLETLAKLCSVLNCEPGDLFRAGQNGKRHKKQAVAGK